MAARSLGPRLADILENIGIVEGGINGRDLASFTADPILRLAVERAIEIVSEATRHIPEDVRERHADVPWRTITRWR